jgi:hypothetical protein
MNDDKPERRYDLPPDDPLLTAATREPLRQRLDHYREQRREERQRPASGDANASVNPTRPRDGPRLTDVERARERGPREQ